MANVAGRPRIEIKIDLTKYTDVLTDRLCQLVATRCRNTAKKLVRISPPDSGHSGNLRNNIMTERVTRSYYITYVNPFVPYALPQEFGRPDLPKYGFTPYMRPAADEAGSETAIAEELPRAEEAALNQARMRKNV